MKLTDSEKTQLMDLAARVSAPLATQSKIEATIELYRAMKAEMEKDEG